MAPVTGFVVTVGRWSREGVAETDDADAPLSADDSNVDFPSKTLIDSLEQSTLAVLPFVNK